MKRGIGLLVAACAIIFAAGRLQAQTTPAAGRPPMEIPHLTGITVDGNPDDWQGRDFFVPAMLPIVGPAKPPAQVLDSLRLGWDERGLLALVSMTDSTPYPDDLKDYGVHDNLQFFCSVNKAWDVVLVVAPGMHPQTPECKGRVFHWASPYASTDDLGFEVARTKTPQGYIVEVLLPWKNLPGFEPKSGAELGFALVANDEFTHTTRYRVTFDSTNRSSRARGLRLADKAGPSPICTATAQQACQFPRLWVSAAAGLAGKAVQVKLGQKVLAQGKLEAAQGCAWGDVPLPMPAPDQPIEPATVWVDDRNVGTVFVPLSTAEQFAFAMIDEKPADGNSSMRRMKLAPAGPPPYDAIKGITAKVQATDLTGKVVAKAETAIDEPFALSLGPGLYRLSAVVADYYGRALDASQPLLTGDMAIVTSVLDEADKLIAQPQQADYAGAMRYFADQVRAGLKSQPLEKAGLMAALNLGECVKHLEAGRSPLRDLRGRLEWAYTSRADGTAQPFELIIPADYDPNVPTPLVIWLHGYGGTHQERRRYPAGIRLTVVGRGIGAGFFGLSEVDVLEAMDYVMAHWNIDPDRVHLAGASMGGGGTFWIGARHPDRFASASPACGGGISAPVENLLNVPVCSLHSTDDGVIESRLPLKWLAQMGGRVVRQEPDGYGHFVEDFLEGKERGIRWMFLQKRQPRPCRVHLAAMDEISRQAYWVQVIEWGPKGGAATVDAQVDASNTLCLSLDNVQCARLDLARSPADANRPLLVAMDGCFWKNVPAPLPSELFVMRGTTGWQLDSRPPAAPAQRLHFPAGAMALYHGEPLMVVWGTQGDEATATKLAEVAAVARKGNNPSWTTVPAYQMSFGMLPGKPDSQVTPEDLAKYNLLLIGTAKQNSLVARMADKLPVRLEGEAIVSGDGQSWPAAERAWGLLYYNPLAPARLIYWAASEDPNFYVARADLMEVQRRDGAPDFALEQGSKIVAARRFDSRWNWQPGYADSPLLADEFCSPASMAQLAAKALRCRLGADFAIAADDGPKFAPGQTRWMDVAATTADAHCSRMPITGSQLRQLAATLARMSPKAVLVPEPQDVQENRTYSLALSPHNLDLVSDCAAEMMDDCQWTPVKMPEIVEAMQP